MLFASLIGANAETVVVDLAKGAHKTPEYLAINPFGQVPVLEDGDTVVSDSTAILVYLAKKFGRTDWLPEEGQKRPRAFKKWLSVASGQGPSARQQPGYHGLRRSVQRR